jgi:PAS domain S-box-containing protein
VSNRSQEIGAEFTKLVEGSFDAVCIAGFDGYLKRVNPSFGEMLGYTQEELLSRPFMDNVHPDDREMVEAGMATLARGDDILGLEVCHLCADGSPCWIEWNTHAAPADGVVYAIGRDVTDRNRTNDALSALADEQAALRRVATLVAQGAPPHDVFGAAAEDVARVFSLSPETSDVASVVRFDPGPEFVLVGTSKSIEGIPLESRWRPKDLYASTRVSRTGRSARVDAQELDPVDDADAEALRRQRLLSQVGSPIVVDGRLWGAMTINAYEELPANTEERLEKFTELAATAIANAESGEARAVLTEEQAALRRVATLVAREPSQADLFAAIAREAR